MEDNAMANACKEFKNKYGIHITTGHTGKMEGIDSLSTSVLLNPICQKRAKDPTSICSKCFAEKIANARKELRGCLAKNTEVLTSQIIPVKEWPVLNASIFRLESFGDLNNGTQFKNYINFAKRNPRTTFALWTKNTNIVDEVFREGVKKPRNMIIIMSSPHLNRVMIPRYEWVDKVFTVYDKEHAEGVEINCGARDCLTCQRCYTKTRKVEYIRELLK